MGSALEQHQTIILQQKKMEVSASLLKLTENFISESVPFENMVAELLVGPFNRFIFATYSYKATFWRL